MKTCERFCLGSDRPNSFADDNPNSSRESDTYLRAFFRTFISAIQICFSVFLLVAAKDEPRPVGGFDISLRLYKETGCWNESRRGSFPFNMDAWQWTRITSDEMEMVRFFPRFLFQLEIDK